MLYSTRPFTSRASSATMDFPFLRRMISAEAAPPSSAAQSRMRGITIADCSNNFSRKQLPISALRILPVVFLLTAALPLRAQESAPAPASAADLYRRLRSVGLDEKQVYQVRDAGLQRDELHLSFNDGTIAFSHDVDGRITAAFFQGEGHILVIPPSNVERFSLSSFTGSAVLEERF